MADQPKRKFVRRMLDALRAGDAIVRVLVWTGVGLFLLELGAIIANWTTDMNITDLISGSAVGFGFASALYFVVDVVRMWVAKRLCDRWSIIEWPAHDSLVLQLMRSEYVGNIVELEFHCRNWGPHTWEIAAGTLTVAVGMGRQEQTFELDKSRLKFTLLGSATTSVIFAGVPLDLPNAHDIGVYIRRGKLIVRREGTAPSEEISIPRLAAYVYNREMMGVLHDT